MSTALDPTTYDPLPRLGRDIRDAVRLADAGQVRTLVDLYYATQDLRINTANQTRALEATDEPNTAVSFLSDQMTRLENQVKSMLDKWSADHPVGQWMREQVGVGPVISSGMLAHIDITKAPTVGHIWRFAGLDPTVKWEKKQRRPWNARLKVLCWKLGDSFVKTSNHDESFYGKLYRERKAIEVERNDTGRFADQAARTLEEKNIREKATRERYESGRLPDGRIDLRARRWAVKIFLAHLHEVWYWEQYGEAPPNPYVLEHVPGHVHKLTPPHWAPPA